MPQPTASDVHVNYPLTQVSIAYIQDQSSFIATQVFPVVRSPNQSNRYFIYKKGDWFRNNAQKRPPSTESAGGGYTLDNTPSFFCDLVAVHKDIDDQVRGNSDAPLDPDRDATMYVTQQLLLRRDIDWVTNYFASSIWATDADVTNATYGNGRWSSGGSTPIKDLRAQVVNIKQSTSYKPNILVLGAQVWQVLQDHPDFLDRIAFGQVGNASVVSPNLLAQVLGIDKVLIAEAVYNSASEGAADSMAYIAGKHALLCYANPNPSLLTPSAGYTFTWTGLFGAGAEGNRISRYRIEQIKSDRIEGEVAYSLSKIASDLGCFFPNCVA